jgi:hypothetical protein
MNIKHAEMAIEHIDTFDSTEKSESVRIITG